MTTVADVDLSTWNRYATSPRLRGSDLFGASLARFFGYEHTSVSAISINSIVVASTSNEAPKALLASASDVSATGSRTLSSTTLNPYQDLEYRWLLTYSDDSPIEDLEGIVDPRDSTAVNPYTDQISPEFTCIIREAGSYKLTLTARAMSATALEVIEQVATTTVTVVEDTQNHLWYDGASGDDANDGLGPWGFGLTTAVYTESTGELTQLGAFASYVHNVSVNFTDRDNYIYISKAGFEGLYRIASKTDNDTIVLEQKLGSDQTAVTSSDGAKQTFDGVGISNTNHHLKGGNTYTITSGFSGSGRANPVTLSSYGSSQATVTSAAVGFLVGLGTSASSSLPSYVRLSSVVFDADGNGGTLQGRLGSTSDTNVTTIILDRSSFIQGNDSTGVEIQSKIATKVTHLLLNDIYVDNRYGTTGKPASRQGIFTDIRSGGWTRNIGGIIDNDADSDVLDHFWYPSGSMSHFHCAYLETRNGAGGNYALNVNAEEISQYVSINNNHFGSNSKFGIDASNANNEADVKYFLDYVATQNTCNTTNGFAWNYSCQSGTFSYNQGWGATESGFVRFIAGSNFDADDYQAVIRNNSVHGELLTKSGSGATREIVDNEVYHTLDEVVLRHNTVSLGVREYICQGNNLYAPNKTSNTSINIDAVDSTLGTFNASDADISGNTGTLPSWPDGSTGNFGGVPLGLAVTVV